MQRCQQVCRKPAFSSVFRLTAALHGCLRQQGAPQRPRRADFGARRMEALATQGRAEPRFLPESYSARPPEIDSVVHFDVKYDLVAKVYCTGGQTGGRCQGELDGVHAAQAGRQTAGHRCRDGSQEGGPGDP